MSNIDLSVVDVEDFLNALDVERVQRTKDDEIKFSCPFPGHTHGDADPSAYMKTADSDKPTAFICFGCGETGNAVTFLAKHEEATIEQAKIWIRQEYGGEFKEPESTFAIEWDEYFRETEVGEPEVINPVLDENYIDMFSIGDWKHFCDIDHPIEGYMLRRGFTVDTLNSWQIGYDEISDRFTIPIRNEAGELIGFKGRTPHADVQPRYQILGDRLNPQTNRYGFYPYRAQEVLFGLDRTGQKDECVLIEGELNVISADQKGFDNFIGLGGSSILSSEQIRLLRWHFDSVVLFYDSLKKPDEGTIGPAFEPDMAGLKATWKAIQKLEPHMPVRVVDYHVGDPNDMAHEEIKHLVDNAVSSLEVTLA